MVVNIVSAVIWQLRIAYCTVVLHPRVPTVGDSNSPNLNAAVYFERRLFN
jgi:hypothetical protein